MAEESIADMVKDKIGAFKVVRSLGRGLMGEVFLGMTSDNVHNAIKVIDWNRVKRLETAVKFENEIKDDALMQISIKNDAKLQDYFVMDFLEVRPVSRKIVGPYGHTLIMDTFVTAAKALAKAHAAGVIHGNLKSTNLLIRRSPRSLMPFVNDFGLEYIWDRDVFTGDAALASIPYMAPEKIKFFEPDAVADDLPEPGPAGDVYSLAVVLCEALTGKLLFSESDQIEDIVEGKRNPRFQLIAVTHPSRKIDIGALNELVNRCLSFNPADRPAGMEELAEALEGCKVPREKMYTFD
jgi:serine/threonine protein kinase